MEFGEFRFLHPYFWLLLSLIPIGILMASKRVKRGTLLFSSIAPFQSIRPSFRLRLRFIVPFFRVLALCCIILALSRPQSGSELSPERSKGVGIMIVVDNSGSMRADDFSIDGKDVMRIDAVKKVVHEFIRGSDQLPGRPNDEIGLVSFSGYPVPRAPVTLDHGAVLEILETINVADPDKMEKDQYNRILFREEFETAIGDALALAADRLRNTDVKSKILILLSDGSQTMGELQPDDGAKIAQSFGIKVYTIGIGNQGYNMITVNDPFFGKRKVQRRSDLDETTLKRIAEQTGGKYFNAANTNALREVYSEIDQLEPSDIETTRFHRWDEQFFPLALGGLFFLVLEVLLAQTVFRRIP